MHQKLSGEKKEKNKEERQREDYGFVKVTSTKSWNYGNNLEKEKR